ncbi:hypothetical protein [Burkholderia ubonensis]
MRDAHIASTLVERYKVALDTINKCKYNQKLSLRTGDPLSAGVLSP